MELTPVKSSGSEVTVDIKIKPNHALPIPVRLVIISPYFESLAPLKIMIAEQATNPVMVNINAGITHCERFYVKLLLIFILPQVLPVMEVSWYRSYFW